MHQKSGTERSLVISYLALRRIIGIIGLLLPFILVLGQMAFGGNQLEPSISGYYYTAMRDVFVGSLCAIGICLLSYRGYNGRDDTAGNLACLCVVGTAFFPAMPLNPTPHELMVGYLHYGFATGFFLTLAYFCLFPFRKTDAGKGPVTRQKRQRNAIYTVCGYTILACIAAVTIFGLFFANSVLAIYYPIFWLETLAIISFSVAWLIKGETILRDPALATV